MDFLRLVELSNRYSAQQAQGVHEIPGLSIYRREAPSNESDVEAYIYEPVLCLVLQGSKSASLRDREVSLEPGHALLVSHDLPVVSRIIKASKHEPYLAIILALDLQLIRSLYAELTELPVPDPHADSFATAPAEPIWVAPLARYLELLDNPVDARALGPSILREIHYRLLCSSIGGMLRKFLVAESHESRIALSIQKLRQDYHSAIRVDDLAKMVGMSTSSFHEHFKAVTGSTPLQYQKDLRLIEARGLLTASKHTVAQAAFAVGYQSPHHFSRDYSRTFGVPPSRDCGTVTLAAE
ncbi:MAG: AraC family transcriptional regulator N-terminal domain-containing protein [Sphingorhabdus sp.]